MGQPLIRRLKTEAPSIAEAMMAAMVSEVPAYAALSEALRTVVVCELNEIVSVSLTQIGDGRPRTDEELQLFFTHGVRRAAAGLHLDDVKRAYAVSTLGAGRRLWRIADENDWEEIASVTSWLAAETPRAAAAAALGYASANGERDGMAAARVLTIEHLLAGRRSQATAAANLADITLANSYHVLAARVPPSQSRTAGPMTGIITDDRFAPGVLVQQDVATITVLIPADGTMDDAMSLAHHAHIQLAGLFEPCPVPAVLAVSESTQDVPETAATARMLLGLVAAVPDAHSRIYRADDLLIERAVASHPPFTNGLARLMAPIYESPMLTATMSTLLACDLDRERTATEMHVHRRTISYRLNRIRELTGLDIRTAHGIALLRAGIIAHHIHSNGSASMPTGAGY